MAKNETKHERFVRVAETRTQNVIDSLRVLAKCSRTDVYEYTPEEVDKILEALDAEIQEVRNAFAGKNKFTLADK